MYPRAFRTVLPLSVAAATILSMAAPAVAQPAPAAGAAAARPVAAITDGLARELALSLADPATARRVAAATSAAPADAVTLAAGAGFAQSARTANRAVFGAKGLAVTGDSLLRVRLAHPDMRAALGRGEVPLVATAPSDDTATDVTAYDPSGARIMLDGTRVPTRPVLVVEVDVARALPLGLRVMRETLDASGVTSATAPGGTGRAATLAGGYWANKVTAVRLSDDEEPWIKGDAEIYSIVGGFGLSGDPKIDIVQMPYLNNDGTTYYPNQLLVHYSAYKYNLADVVMMEDDGDTNYLQLAQAIASALLYIVDGGAYTPLVNAILAAIPSSWWTDDPDYVDSWYTLATSTSGRRYGAAGNGWMDLVPYWVEAF